ncbi:hypothetical protein [Aquimarina algiphila]|nr:hypothetical protein [Aquimarina algiphila]
MKLISLTEEVIRNKLFEGVKKTAKRKELNDHSYYTMHHFKEGKERDKK